MRFMILSLVLFTAAPAFAQGSRGVRDFAVFATAVDQQISIVEMDGTTREGLVVAVGADGLTVKFADGTRTYTRTQIASAERLKDGRLDGVVKGLLWGAVLGWLGSQGYTSQESAFSQWARGVAMFGVIGYVVDASETNREVLYRAPSTSSTAGTPLSASLAFRIRF